MHPFEESRACRRCSAVLPHPVAGDPAGTVRARVLFVGEAPGRLGAGRTGVPFNGDQSGRRFALLLAEAGLGRDEIFATNAALCVPVDARGRNRRPRVEELESCSSHLAATLAFVDPALVVALGTVALAALGRIETHGQSLHASAGLAFDWYGRTLFALYHPGQRTQVHRPWERQVEDWRRLGALVRSRGLKL